MSRLEDAFFGKRMGSSFCEWQRMYMKWDFSNLYHNRLTFVRGMFEVFHLASMSRFASKTSEVEVNLHHQEGGQTSSRNGQSIQVRQIVNHVECTGLLGRVQTYFSTIPAS
jgi:hypothetical protein